LEKYMRLIGPIVLFILGAVIFKYRLDIPSPDALLTAYVGACAIIAAPVLAVVVVVQHFVSRRTSR
jgi:hypothetical protein